MIPIDPSAPARRAHRRREMIRLSSANTRSGATERSPSALVRRRGERSGLDREIELAREPREPHRPQRVARERVGRHHPQTAPRRSSQPAERVHRPPSNHGCSDRVDRNRAGRDPPRSRPPRAGRQVDLPRVSGRRLSRPRSPPRARTRGPRPRGPASARPARRGSPPSATSCRPVAPPSSGRERRRRRARREPSSARAPSGSLTHRHPVTVIGAREPAPRSRT